MNQTSYTPEEILELVKECGTGNENALQKFFDFFPKIYIISQFVFSI